MTEQKGLEDFDCPMGCNKNDRFVLNARDLLCEYPGYYTVVQCLDCGLLRTNPRPSNEMMSSYYSDQYHVFNYKQKHFIELKSGKRISILKNLIKRAFTFHVTPLPPLKAGKFLEIGCGTGQFLDLMKEKGWNSTGIELSPGASEYARQRGHSVWNGEIGAFEFPPSHYDLIVGWMVLEHLHSPVEILKKIHYSAKAGAWLALSMPNIGGIAFRLFKSYWYGLQVPGHLYHFTPKTIRAMLEKAGWKTEAVFFHRVASDSIASAALWLANCSLFKKASKSIISYVKRGGRLNYLFFPLGLFLSTINASGRMTVWARKHID